jgi:hypothetical protein
MLFANESASPLKESLTYSLVSLYFGLRWVSLAEYFLVLKALFSLLLQMVRCTTVIALIVYILRWVTTRTKGRVTPYVLSNAFVGMTISWHCILTKCVYVIYETICFRYFILNLVCNNFMF